MNHSGLFVIHAIIGMWSLYPTKEQHIVHEARIAQRRAEKEKFSPVDSEMTAEQQWQHMWELQQLPRTPGTAGGMRSPTTPRTRAFNDLDGGAAGYYHAEVHSPIHNDAYDGK